MMEHMQSKSFVERSMYKREMCKNWTESGFCRYGAKCQYAHGQQELSETNQLYLNEQKQGLNDKYKSQNCRQFYREKFCPYGKRCHFRHEYRSFKKIHRHFYMAHLAAFSITHADILFDSKIAPDGHFEDSAMALLDTASSDLSFEGEKHAELKTQSCDLSTDDDASTDQSEDFASTIYKGTRLSIFQQICQQSDSKAKEDGQADGGLLKLMNLETQQDFEETWSQSSVEQLIV